MPSLTTDYERLVERITSHSIRFVDLSLGSQELDARLLFAESERIAAALEDHFPCDRALLALESAHAFLPVFWACLKLGITAIPLPEDDGEAMSAFLQALFRGDPHSRILCDERGYQRASRLAWATGLPLVGISQLLQGEPRVTASRRRDPTLALTTSGTGSHPQMVCFANDSGADEEYRPRRVLNTFPVSSISGIGQAYGLQELAVSLPLETACRNPDRLLQAIEAHSIQSLQLPPVLVTRLIRHLRYPDRPRPTRDLSSLERINVGSSRIQPQEFVQLRELLRPLMSQEPLIQYGYGLTQTGLLAFSAFDESHLQDWQGGHLIGPLTQNVELSIRDATDLREVSPGEIGRLFVRKPGGYMGDLVRRPDGSLAVEPFRSGEDWFDTGDRGRLVEDRLVLHGREKDVLIVNSRKVALESIEAALMTALPGTLQDLIAVASPREDTPDEDLQLFYVQAPEQAPLDPGQLEQTLQRLVREQFGLGIRSIAPIAEDQIPRTRTGKVRRQELAARHRPPTTVPVPIDAGPSDSSIISLLLQGLMRHSRSFRNPDPDAPLSSYDLDSLQWITLIGEVEQASGQHCHLAALPANPSVRQVATLFAPGTTTMPRSPEPETSREPELAYYPIRSLVADSIRLSNLGSRGKGWGPSGLARCFNPTGRNTPLVILSGVSERHIEAIAARVPDHPVIRLRIVRGYRSPHNLDYLSHCYLDWIEEGIGQSPYLLLGNCYGALLAYRTAQLLSTRGRPPQVTGLLEWHPRFRDQLAALADVPYPGAAFVHLHADAGTEITETALSQLLPRHLATYRASTRYNEEFRYAPGVDPLSCSLRLLAQLNLVTATPETSEAPAVWLRS